jgi:hypothetical protein
MYTLRFVKLISNILIFGLKISMWAILSEHLKDLPIQESLPAKDFRLISFEVNSLLHHTYTSGPTFTISLLC